MLLLHMLHEAVLAAEGGEARIAADLPSHPHPRPRRESVLQDLGRTASAMDHLHVLC